MNYIALDTHRMVKRLQLAGFNDNQAEIVADLLKENRDVDLSALATKVDLENFHNITKADIESLRKDTKADIESLRKDTRTDIESLRKDTKADISDLRKDNDVKFAQIEMRLMKEIATSRIETIKWTVGSIIAMSAFLTGVMTYLLRTLK